MSSSSTYSSDSLDTKLFTILGDMREQTVALQLFQERNTTNEAIIRHLTKQLEKKDKKINKLKKKCHSAVCPSNAVEYIPIPRTPHNSSHPGFFTPEPKRQRADAPDYQGSRLFVSDLADIRVADIGESLSPKVLASFHRKASTNEDVDAENRRSQSDDTDMIPAIRAAEPLSMVTADVHDASRGICNTVNSEHVRTELDERKEEFHRHTGLKGCCCNECAFGPSPDEVAQEDDDASDVDYLSVHSSNDEDQELFDEDVQTAPDNDVQSIQSELKSDIQEEHVPEEDEKEATSEDLPEEAEEAAVDDEDLPEEAEEEVPIEEAEEADDLPEEAEEEEEVPIEEAEEEDTLVIVFYKGKQYCHDTVTGEIFDLIPNPDAEGEIDPENPDEICGSDVVGMWVDGKIVLKSEKKEKKVKSSK